MSELMTIDAEVNTTEVNTTEVGADEVGSHNHSAIQANLAYLLKKIGDYSVFIELSLDVRQFDSSHLRINDEIKPDVCIYPKRGLSRPYDILKMSEMPLLAIEILPPRQAAIDILEKFEVYFALGVQSCWLVDPTTEVVAIYSTLAQHQSFSADEVVDKQLGIHLALAEIFE